MLTSLTLNKLCVVLEGWIIQSGERCDISVGCEEEIAFEFFCCSSSLKVTLEQNKKADNTYNEKYHITGEVVFLTDDIIVIDIGVFIFQRGGYLNFSKGSWVSGEINIGVDPFSTQLYFEPIEDMPDIYYSCRIDKILINKTPFLQKKYEGFPCIWVTRDKNRERYEEISKTSAKSDGTFVDYLLYCTVLSHVGTTY